MELLTQTVTPELVEVSLASFGNISILLIVLLTSVVGGYFVYHELDLDLPSEHQDHRV